MSKQRIIGITLAGLSIAGLLILFDYAYGSETGLSATTVSHHFNAPQGKNAPQFNDLNPGIGLYWMGKDFGVDALTYRNSYGRNSFALTGSYEPIQFKYLQAGVFAGVASGYEHPYIGGAYAQVKYEKAALRFIVVPKVGETRNAATSVTAQVRVAF